MTFFTPFLRNQWFVFLIPLNYMFCMNDFIVCTIFVCFYSLFAKFSCFDHLVLKVFVWTVAFTQCLCIIVCQTLILSSLAWSLLLYQRTCLNQPKKWLYQPTIMVNEIKISNDNTLLVVSNKNLKMILLVSLKYNSKNNNKKDHGEITPYVHLKNTHNTRMILPFYNLYEDDPNCMFKTAKHFV